MRRKGGPLFPGVEVVLIPLSTPSGSKVLRGTRVVPRPGDVSEVKVTRTETKDE